MTDPNVTFVEWLHRFVDDEDDDSLGDLARDVRDDACFPRDASTWDEVHAHLTENHQPIDDALDVAHEAMRQWAWETGRAEP